MRNKKTRVLSLMLALVMAAGMLAGCTKDKGTAGDQGTAGGQQEAGKGGDTKVKDSITIATANETPSLTPNGHNAVAGDYMNLLTYSTLFRTGMDLNPQPLLVEDYKNVSDTEWQFTLKSGVKFHDGTELKAEDVAASIKWSQGFPEVALYNKDIVDIVATGDYTFTITTEGPDAMLLSNLTHHGNAIVPKALIDSGNNFNEKPIGTGPYKFIKWNRGDSIEFEAFEEYFLGAPAIKKMTWKVIPEGSSRTIALEAGEVDMVIEVEAMDGDRLKGNNKIEVIEYNATNESWLMLNNEKPGLDNQDVRRAINAAINKENVVTVAYNGMATPALSQMPMNFEGATEENADAYDAAKAKEYMTKSGVDPASVQLAIICSDDTKKRAGEVIQANLKEIGINATIENMDLATYLSATATGDYTGAIGGYSSTSLLGYVVGVFHSDSIDASNKARMRDAEVDALIDEAKVTVDEAARKVIMEKLSARVNELCPQAPLWQPVTMRAFNANLQGVEVNDAGGLNFETVSWKS